MLIEFKVVREGRSYIRLGEIVDRQQDYILVRSRATGETEATYWSIPAPIKWDKSGREGHIAQGAAHAASFKVGKGLNRK